jgi:AbrB family looped-hinge helix DNA binding protein
MAGSRISSKGQVTIPQEVRIRLGLRPGDRVEFVNEGGKTVILPERRQLHSFREYIGAAPGLHTREAIDSWVREIREDDRLPE